MNVIFVLHYRVLSTMKVAKCQPPTLLLPPSDGHCANWAQIFTTRVVAAD